MTDVDPTLEILRQRKAELMAEATTITARLSEVERLITMLEDGRSSVRRKMKGGGNSDSVHTKPSPTLHDAYLGQIDAAP